MNFCCRKTDLKTLPQIALQFASTTQSFFGLFFGKGKLQLDHLVKTKQSFLGSIRAILR